MRGDGEHVRHVPVSSQRCAQQKRPHRVKARDDNEASVSPPIDESEGLESTFLHVYVSHKNKKEKTKEKAAALCGSKE
jgi:hypothetical protein